MQNKTIKLATGVDIPQLGFGTWQLAPNLAKAAILEAIQIGYRHIDCAWIYGNEAVIGEALAEAFAKGVVKREELFITSKLWNSHHAVVDVKKACVESIKRLGCDYLDLYLMHWPIEFKSNVLMPETDADYVPLTEIPLAQTWQAMETLTADGLVRQLGVSNFSVQKLKSLLSTCKIQPVMNQIEMHPLLQQNAMLDFANANQLCLTAYSPLGSGQHPNQPVLLETPTIIDIAKQHAATPAQVSLAWALQRGTIAIPKSANSARIQENFNSQSLQLSADDIKQINALDQHHRFVHGDFFTSAANGYTLNTLWDE